MENNVTDPPLGRDGSLITTEITVASAIAAAEKTSFFVLPRVFVDIKKSSLKMHARRGCNIVASFRRYYPVQVMRVRSEAFLSNMLP